MGWERMGEDGPTIPGINSIDCHIWRLLLIGRAEAGLASLIRSDEWEGWGSGKGDPQPNV